MVSAILDLPNWAKTNGPLTSNQIGWIHSAECPLRGGFARSLTLASNTNASYIASWFSFVGPEVRVRQVPAHLTAWTQGYGNPFGPGWEQEGYAAFTREQWLTPLGLLQLENLAQDMAEWARKHGVPARWLTTDEVQAVCFGGNRTIKGFAIHAQIANDRTDPGPNYPYDILINRIAQINGDPRTTGPRPPAHIEENPAPKPTAKEWYEMAIPAEDLKRIYQAIWFGVPGADLIPRRLEKGGEWPEATLGSMTDRIVRQNIQPLRREVEQANAVSENLAKALAAVAKGEQLDIPKLLAGVQESARVGSAQGVKESIESIETTVTVKETS